MRRHDDDSAAGQDSFLDIVANIVGILIILVLVVGMRAKNAPVTLSIASPEQKAARDELKGELATGASIESDIVRTNEEIKNVLLTKQERFAERSQLALMQSALEYKIRERRGQLDTDAQAEFDRGRNLAAAESRLAQLRQEEQQASNVQAAPIRIENYPTPISKTVNGRELHIQLRAGRLTVIPWDELIEELKTTFHQKIYKMQAQSELNDQFGPIGGFRVRYTMERHDASMRTYEETGQGGSYVRLKKFSLMPVSSQLGEPFNAALADGSEFRQALSRHRPDWTTVTVWTYPDSFDEFRRLRQELYKLGYAVAGRPLPEGMPIGGSPEGTRSASE